jgi:hypothetical protein
MTCHVDTECTQTETRQQKCINHECVPLPPPSIDDICSNEKGVDAFPQYTQQYYQQVCSIRDRLQKDQVVSPYICTFGLGAVLKECRDIFEECYFTNGDGEATYSICAKIENLAKFPEKLIEGMIKGIFTPKGVAMLGIQTSLHYLAKSPKMLENFMENLKLELDTSVEEIVSEVAVEEVESVALTNLTATSVVISNLADNMIVRSLSKIFGAALEGASEVGTFVLTTIAESWFLSLGVNIIGGLAGFLNGLGLAAMAVQIVGQILDSIDPCNYQMEMDATKLNIITTKYNDTFRSSILGSVGSTVDQLGNVYINEEYPIEKNWSSKHYSAQERSQYQKLASKHTARYLSSMQYNLNGEPITWPLPHSDHKVVTRGMFKDVEKSLASILSLGNTVTENFVLKYFPAIMAIVIGLLALVIYCIY